MGKDLMMWCLESGATTSTLAGGSRAWRQSNGAQSIQGSDDVIRQMRLNPIRQMEIQ
jgi:hypothetical protein